MTNGKHSRYYVDGEINIRTFFIHYTKLVSRLGLIRALRDHLSLTNATIITAHDSEDIDATDYLSSATLWSDRLLILLPILLANSYISNQRHAVNYFAYLKEVYRNNYDVPKWAVHRTLRLGEISVLLKHFTAISAIATGDQAHGLICEDDLLFTMDSYNNLTDVLRQLPHNTDYIDLAGGAGLRPCPYSEPVSQELSHLTKLLIPRTRTNAAYVLSKRLAIYFKSRFFPLVFPIDWHLQYLLLTNIQFNCYWTTEPILIHGSETPFLESWRTDVQ